jgi:hypothetical protein
MVTRAQKKMGRRYSFLKMSLKPAPLSEAEIAATMVSVWVVIGWSLAVTLTRQ